MNTDLTPYEPRGDVAHTDPTGGRLVAWAEAASAAHSLAKSLCTTSFVPKAFAGNPGDATAAIILGDELGLSPLSALRALYVIGGTPALYARTMVALVMAHGHEVWTVEETEQRVTVAGRRRGSDHEERVTWTIARAQKAGYTNNKKYATDPIAMLYARAAGDVARRIAPDVLAGVPYSVEEIELSEGPATTTVTRETAARRTVSRAPKVEAEPEPEQVEAEPVDVSDAEVVPDPDAAPDTRTEAQSRALHASFRDHGLTDRDDALAYCASVLGREVTTTKDLTRDEASRVLDAMVALGGGGE